MTFVITAIDYSVKIHFLYLGCWDNVMTFLGLSFWTNRSLNFFLCTQITKKRASHKPTYENLQKSLEAMKSHCLKNGVTDLSMPRIGCGLDRLKWENVSAIIEEVFDATDIRITVYTL
ncbi:O-acyl-ADP-ribose deacylase 1 [Phyllostomus discolor]|uniref:O-acyl-ADP-ribose deacylase 1 n=1 Tax=Phyllostomus discolor TaxID=89673 RepID=A0A834EIE0_9CHIR|nr:O-acyl-ADP-ribose deacylase 1 [Phyllostomus discolor]